MKKRKSRYISFMESDLLYLSKLIINAYYNDELVLIVVHGKQGFGNYLI